MNYTFDMAIEYVKGVGPERASTLKKELGIYRVKDLLEHYPFRYIDRSKFYKIREINSEETFVQLFVVVRSVNEVGMGRAKRLVAKVADDTGGMELVWFKGIKWVKPKLIVGKKYVVFGKPKAFNRTYNISHPDFEPAENLEKYRLAALQPVYPSTEKLTAKGLHSKGIEKVIRTVYSGLSDRFYENLPETYLKKLKLPHRHEAIKQIHLPSENASMERARFRMKFEEFFFQQLTLLSMKLVRMQKVNGFVFDQVGHHFNTFFNEVLPFELTGAQKRVVKEIRADMKTGKHMNRLLQGDVGSGKTLVALLAVLIALDNGYQACLMAPTEILATQHYHTIKEMMDKMEVPVALLTGSTKTAERKKIHEDLENGKLKILIGTHALIEDKVKFNNLGFAVIDEQHRFGVAQRASLWKKNKLPPHILVMTATPIPRTLAMSCYGDLDVSVIDELPPGRKPVTTLHKFDGARLRVFKFMEEQIALGRQIYVVYPLIEESEKLDYKDLMDGFESITRRFPMPKYQVSIVHGRMKPEEKDYEMDRFVKGQTHIMVATTVIEVGVNVPNASVMIIESAERFGLSQLHQLRGRVGRGAEQSFCILMTGDKLGSDARKRIRVMCDTNDGFKISEVDMKLRGPGDILGTRQSGLVDLKLADLIHDQKILEMARNAAIDLLERDPELTDNENKQTKTALQKQLKEKSHWSRIS